MDLSHYEAGAVVGVPDAPASPSVGNPTNGNPQRAVPATTPGEYWFYQLQKEFAHVLSEAGIAPNVNTLTQLAQAIQALIAFASAAVNDFRLIKSGEELTFERVTGNQININGILLTLDGTLPTLGATGLAAATTYYVYAYAQNDGTVALEADTTGYTVGTSGRAEKTGDTSRRLVGMARTADPVAWSDNPCLVLSYAHRQRKATANGLPASAPDASTTSTTFVKLDSTNLSVEFLTWDRSLARVYSVGVFARAGTVDTDVITAIGIDGTSPERGGTAIDGANRSASIPFHVLANRTDLAEGLHTGFLLGRVVGTNNSGGWGDSHIGSANANVNIFAEVFG